MRCCGCTEHWKDGASQKKKMSVTKVHSVVISTDCGVIIYFFLFYTFRQIAWNSLIGGFDEIRDCNNVYIIGLGARHHRNEILKRTGQSKRI